MEKNLKQINPRNFFVLYSSTHSTHSKCLHQLEYNLQIINQLHIKRTKNNKQFPSNQQRNFNLLNVLLFSLNNNNNNNIDFDMVAERKWKMRRSCLNRRGEDLAWTRDAKVLLEPENCWDNSSETTSVRCL